MGKRGKKRTEHRTSNGIEEKLCYKCMEWHPLDSFGSDKNAWDGLQHECKECRKKHTNTKMGRAAYLLNGYNKEDEKRGRGKGDLTAKWIVDNIFSKPCVHCGESDWRKIGCNRLDNSKPHTKNNVEPCCKECNDKLGLEYRKSISKLGRPLKKVYQINMETKEIVKCWNSAKEAADVSGFSQTCISNVANGKSKKHKGYRWSYKPL